jgi:hypothetical protein
MVQFVTRVECGELGGDGHAQQHHDEQCSPEKLAAARRSG